MSVYMVLGARNVLDFFNDADANEVRALRQQLATSMGSLQQYSSAHLKQLINMRVTTDFRASIGAVTLMIPASTQDNDCAVAVLNLAHITIDTETSRVCDDYPFEKYNLQVAGTVCREIG